MSEQPLNDDNNANKRKRENDSESISEIENEIVLPYPLNIKIFDSLNSAIIDACVGSYHLSPWVLLTVVTRLMIAPQLIESSRFMAPNGWSIESRSKTGAIENIRNGSQLIPLSVFVSLDGLYRDSYKHRISEEELNTYIPSWSSEIVDETMVVYFWSSKSTIVNINVNENFVSAVYKFICEIKSLGKDGILGRSKIASSALKLAADPNADLTVVTAVLGTNAKEICDYCLIIMNSGTISALVDFCGVLIGTFSTSLPHHERWSIFLKLKATSATNGALQNTASLLNLHLPITTKEAENLYSKKDDQSKLIGKAPSTVTDEDLILFGPKPSAGNNITMFLSKLPDFVYLVPSDPCSLYNRFVNKHTVRFTELGTNVTRKQPIEKGSLIVQMTNSKSITGASKVPATKSTMSSSASSFTFKF